jgi:hypothetical protein
MNEFGLGKPSNWAIAHVPASVVIADDAGIKWTTLESYFTGLEPWNYC